MNHSNESSQNKMMIKHNRHVLTLLKISYKMTLLIEAQQSTGNIINKATYNLLLKEVTLKKH